MSSSPRYTIRAWMRRTPESEHRVVPRLSMRCPTGTARTEASAQARAISVSYPDDDVALVADDRIAATFRDGRKLYIERDAPEPAGDEPPTAPASDLH